MIATSPQAAAPSFRAAFDAAERVLLLTHVNPDGDAIGSLLGLAHTLRAAGKTVFTLASSPIPSYIRTLPGAEEIPVYQRGTALPEVDLTWLVDTADLARIGPIAEQREHLLSRPLVIVDHHVTNSGEGMLNLIDPGAASCAELLFDLLCEMGLSVPPVAATALYFGVINDTQSFQTSSTRAESLRVAADLLKARADHQLVVRSIYFSTPLAQVRLTGLALQAMQVEEAGLLWCAITLEMVKQVGLGEDMGDNVIGVMQRVSGMQIAALFKERHDGSVKISLRSVPGINVAAICAEFGGGGHAQAAGATLTGSLAQAQERVLPLLRAALS